MLQPGALSAQRVDHAQGTRRSAPRTAISAPVFAAAARTAVTVLPVVSSGADSVRAILQRDLDYSDRVRIVVANTMTRAAAAVVRATPVQSGYEVALLDPATGAVREQRTFAVPSLPAPRTATITDSVALSLAARAAYARAQFAALAERREVLLREVNRGHGHFWTSGARDAWERRVQRDRLAYGALLREDSLTHAAARADTVAAAAGLRAALVHDAFQRDSTAEAQRWAVHGIADEVTSWITGTRGNAQSRIAYVADGRIHVVDADGANDHVVETGGDAMSPAWRHDGRAIVFSTMTDAGTQIAWVDLVTGRITRVGAAQHGLNITPVFSPDDQWVLFAHGDDARTGLYAAPANGSGPARRIGGDRWDDESPVFSPDGSRVAFISSRPRTPQIYSIPVNGVGGERLETPFARGVRSYRTSPDWSPDGSTIAYEQQNGDFQVWTVDRTDQRERRLTSVGENEDPSWAPDSRHLALTSNRGGAKAIWVLDTQSGRFRRVGAAPNARLAAWSPALPNAF